MEVALDLRKSAAENANSYYQRAKKSKKKIAGAEKALQETLDKIAILEEKKLKAQLKFKEKEEIPVKKA